MQAHGRTVGREISSVLEGYDLMGLGHGLVAGLPCTEAVTTNYDRLFERACEGVGQAPAVLPYAPAMGTQRWLLKMHGCVKHEDDIVLTRQNYLRYAERNAALAGIVQAMLITKHMLFLMFSLRDDNFLRIVDQVRRAVHPESAALADPDHRLGTAIMLFDNPLLADLWRNEIDWVCLGDEKLDKAEAGRRFEIFLDYLSFRASSPGHLLDPRFEGVLSEEDILLRRLLAPLLQADPDARKSPAWPAVRDLLGSSAAFWYGDRMGLLTRLRAETVYTAVIRPIRMGKRLMPDRLFGPLGAASLRVGRLAGVLSRLFLALDTSPRGRLRALLRFTELAEESLGIRGTNEIVDDSTARRTIHTCPFADRIRDLPEFCTCIGADAGRGAFRVLAAGAEFVVLRAKSQGAPVCEYEYRIPRQQGDEPISPG